MPPPNDDTHETNDSADEVAIEGSPKEVFEALSSPYRRCVLHYFHSRDDDIAALEELYQFIRSSADLEVNEDHARVQLRHHHLPLLEQKGFIEYDTRDNMIRYRGDDPLIERFLGLVSDYDLD